MAWKPLMIIALGYMRGFWGKIEKMLDLIRNQESVITAKLLISFVAAGYIFFIYE